MIFDEVLQDAAARAAETPIYAGPKGPEANLTASIRVALDALGHHSLSSEIRYEIPGWTRPPGGVDLVADLADGTRVLMEMKKGKPDEALWDALKLGDIAEMDTAPVLAGAYLVYDGDAGDWAPTRDGARLFTECPRVWDARELIEAWPNAWLWLLKGGNGIRPREGIGAIRIEPVTTDRLKRYPDRTLRIVKVAPVQGVPPQHYDRDGWPSGYEPPAGMRSAIQRADGQSTHRSSNGPTPTTR